MTPDHGESEAGLGEDVKDDYGQGAERQPLPQEGCLHWCCTRDSGWGLATCSLGPRAAPSMAAGADTWHRWRELLWGSLGTGHSAPERQNQGICAGPHTSFPPLGTCRERATYLLQRGRSEERPPLPQVMTRARPIQVPRCPLLQRLTGELSRCTQVGVWAPEAATPAVGCSLPGHPRTSPHGRRP